MNIQAHFYIFLFYLFIIILFLYSQQNQRLRSLNSNRTIVIWWNELRLAIKTFTSSLPMSNTNNKISTLPAVNSLYTIYSTHLNHQSFIPTQLTTDYRKRLKKIKTHQIPQRWNIYMIGRSSSVISLLLSSYFCKLQRHVWFIFWQLTTSVTASSGCCERGVRIHNYLL